ncbi:hypothetical protein [Arthrobacter bambusae]|uniref:Uncharacterized protein n=1 Tax=Arthrobacter bambusae TaxID=1338426 RepID=A0AAW8DGR3_9MICC|nr:hypothetical protein [Arthrobacter bambusae]MDP9904555.1 hypothetical protein [Arthrobacter bambusae]MDQ0129370.1 hypothetical protein [Arthrobacter bambusae]MDQ0181017.1 hypothetical protein [Arthrobacter bambusae]
MIQTTALAASATPYSCVGQRSGMVARLRTRVAAQPTWVRTFTGVLLLALLVPLMFFMATSTAHAADQSNQDQKDYSLYHLASNANVYFTLKSSPDQDGMGVQGDWKKVAANPAQAGSMMGYADDGNFVNWLFSTVSGASHTIKYSAFDDKASGMKGYAQFGAANADLGLDKMHSDAGFDLIVHGVGGAMMWFVYILAMGVGLLFWGCIQILQFLNPFLWFHKGLAAVSPAYRNFADGMVTTNTNGQETVHAAPSGLSGLESFIADWYGTLVSMSWGVLVPLFIGFLLLGLVFFKKMDRGSAFKKLLVRVLFLAFGLPLFGGMYTSILTQFSEDLSPQNSGPTQVVASTYVDFENWMNKDRLHVPDGASITWDPSTGHALPTSTSSVRNTALAINKQVHPDAFEVGPDPLDAKKSSASAAWANTSSISGNAANQSDQAGAGMVIDMLWRYTTSQTISASDFESKIQASITDIPKNSVNGDTKKNWFMGQSFKGDPVAKDYGEGNSPVSPDQHPLFATKGAGLTASPVDGGGTSFTSAGVVDCGFRVVEPGSATPGDCNLSPLAAYNYQNTGFSADSMTIYSGQRASSGYTRSFHSSVAQVGTGLSAFMYWANALSLLLSIALLGITYGFGMLFGSVKRGFSTIAAVPFATLGSIASIAKVIIYSVAMILGVLVTVFLYQFASQLLISLPQIIEAPIANLLKVNLLVSAVIGIMTFASILLVFGVTITLIRVRGSVLKAMDEAVTKLVDKFLETNTPPKAGGGGLMPAIAGGLGAGAGSAAGSRLFGGKGSKATGKPGNPSSKSGDQSTNAGGTNGDQEVEAGQQRGELEAGTKGGNSDDGGNAGGLNGSPGSPGLPGGPGSSGTAKALPVGSGSSGADPGNSADGSSPGGPGTGPTGGTGRGSTADQGATINASNNADQGARSLDDRQLAQRVSQQGGLTPLGIGSVGTGGKTTDGRVNTDQPNDQQSPGSRRAGRVSTTGQPRGQKSRPSGQKSRPTGGMSRPSADGQKALSPAPQRPLPTRSAGTPQGQPLPAKPVSASPAVPDRVPTGKLAAVQQTNGKGVARAQREQHAPVPSVKEDNKH